MVPSLRRGLRPHGGLVGFRLCSGVRTALGLEDGRAGGLPVLTLPVLCFGAHPSGPARLQGVAPPLGGPWRPLPSWPSPPSGPLCSAPRAGRLRGGGQGGSGRRQRPQSAQHPGRHHRECLPRPRQPGSLPTAATDGGPRGPASQQSWLLRGLGRLLNGCVWSGSPPHVVQDPKGLQGHRWKRPLLPGGPPLAPWSRLLATVTLVWASARVPESSL